MSNFFNSFPKINYDAFRTNNLIETINITKRFAPIRKLLKNQDLYYKYYVKEGQRPDIVSHLSYGSVNYDWLILMVNDILDPYFKWPLFNDEFNLYLEDKYGSVENSTQTIKFYKKIVRPYQKINEETIIQEQTLVIDYTFYLTLPDYERKIVYAYDYEHDLNEKRKQIQILDNIYLPLIDSEKENIFR